MRIKLARFKNFVIGMWRFIKLQIDYFFFCNRIQCIPVRYFKDCIRIFCIFVRFGGFIRDHFCFINRGIRSVIDHCHLLFFEWKIRFVILLLLASSKCRISHSLFFRSLVPQGQHIITTWSSLVVQLTLLLLNFFRIVVTDGRTSFKTRREFIYFLHIRFFFL